MAYIDTLARSAGFLKAGETTANAAPETGGTFADMDVIGSPVMPEGWLGMRTERGVMCVGPSGSFWVPFYNSSKEQG